MDETRRELMAESPETTEIPPETRGKQPSGATENHVHNFTVNSYLFLCIYTPPAPLPKLDKKSCAQTQS